MFFKFNVYLYNQNICVRGEFLRRYMNLGVNNQERITYSAMCHSVYQQNLQEMTLPHFVHVFQ